MGNKINHFINKSCNIADWSYEIHNYNVISRFDNLRITINIS